MNRSIGLAVLGIVFSISSASAVEMKGTIKKIDAGKNTLTLTVDGNGYLATVKNPANEQTTLSYTATGLTDATTNYFTVKAVNVVGAGLSSTEASDATATPPSPSR